MLLAHNIKIATWNVLSLPSMLKKEPNQFKEFIKKHSPDLIFLQETQVTQMKLLKHEVLECTKWMVSQGYNWYDFNTLSSETHFFGTAFFSKVKPLTWECLSPHGQGRVITMTFSDVFIIAVYAQNAGVELKNLNLKLKWTKYIDALVKPNTLLLGDLNVIHQDIDIWVDKERDPGKWKQYEKEPGMAPIERLDFSEFIKRHKFVDLFRTNHPTKRVYTYHNMRTGELQRYNEGKSDKGWRLDYFMFNGDLKYDNAHVNHIKWEGSDHIPVMLTYTYRPPLKQLLGTVKTSEENGHLLFRQTDANSPDKPMYKMFEYADYHRHTIYIAKQNAQLSYQFVSFKDREEFESYYAKREPKTFYEIIRGRCKLYFDLDNTKSVKPFLQELRKHTHFTINDILIKKSNKGFHVILNTWFSSNEDIKALPWITKLDIDRKVYTKNRLIRLLYSSKFGKDDPFYPVDLEGNPLKNGDATDYMVSLI